MNKELVDKYLEGQCNKHETHYIRQYFQEHPLELERYFTDDEWREHLMENTSRVTEDISGKMYAAIHGSISRKKKKIHTLVKWAGAAAAIIVLFFGIKLFYAETALPEMPVVVKSKVVLATKRHINITKSLQRINLPDGTLVLLSPGSEIKYHTEYNVAKRDIYLQGKAEFDVARDKERPFTVFCGKIATRALGTRFEVNGFVKNTAVILFEGKVVVKNIENEKVRTFLKPGDRTAFNTDKNIFETILRPEYKIAASKAVETEITRISEGTEDSNEIIQKNRIVKHTELNVKAGPAYLKFQNEKLKTVINELSKLYNVEINYPTDISCINIYMSVDSKQPIEKILKNITSLNGLEISKVDSNKYIIKK
ncbi:FecR family protein [Haoranjiania flava]|uniref:FecR family protein n=1 Tax=Haoranjiania flava TaxID=1856322 RepID=A0AAE3ILR9_9BACT|nr:FecR family protein [Haoranjiania flava]MCU7693533.1 FecR family protein [Haoranjiania flava]